MNTVQFLSFISIGYHTDRKVLISSCVFLIICILKCLFWFLCCFVTLYNIKFIYLTKKYDTGVVNMYDNKN
ncbi:hypothetical protein KUTeg_008694 [Tegillarca granosa]|uniref:Uncharacterized protein n=1 Tax=Tegillarca granosa TaxID=220873 RepID=A0ABQ9F9T6_TEGGR|nr:hypothetical protein KUTeg_008694 [Tegillarca granosa]